MTGFFTNRIAVYDQSRVTLMALVSNAQPVGARGDLSFATVNEAIIDNQWSTSLTPHE